MKILKLTSATSIFAVLLIGAAQANAQTVTVDPATLTFGYMNVFNLPAGATITGNGGPADGAYQFGGTWGVSDLVSSFAGSTLTLRPNQIGDPNQYWYQGSGVNNGAPGAPGNKWMDASLYNETTGVYVGTTLTFTANVFLNTLGGALNPYNNTTYSTVAFIKDFAPDYSSFTSSTIALPASGLFSISLLTSGDAGHHIQYGFETIGSDIWATDPILAGSAFTAIVTPVPEPATLALVGVGGMAALAFFRRRNQ